MPLLPQLTKACQERIVKENKTNKLSWITLLFYALISFLAPWLASLFFADNLNAAKQNLTWFAKHIVCLGLISALHIGIYSKLMLKANRHAAQIALFLWLGFYIGSAIGASIWWFVG